MPITSRDIQDIILRDMGERLAERSIGDEWTEMDAITLVIMAFKNEYSYKPNLTKLVGSVIRAIDEMLADGLVVHGKTKNDYKFTDVQAIAAAALTKKSRNGRRRLHHQ